MRTTPVLLSAMLAACVAGPPPALAQQPFAVGSITAGPGSMTSGTLTVAPRGSDEGTTVPVTVVHGTRPGAVLALIAGVHGQEYAPILALQRLRLAIDPKTLTGTVIMVHVANMPSYLGRTIYYSPIDRQNLNRVFPGRPDGTISQRIADVITREIIGKATHVVDLHCGDGNESLRPYLYWITTGSPEVAKVGREMALAFGMDHIVVDRSRPGDPAASVYLSNTAVTRGKPALTIESGGLARTDEESIARVERGVAGLMKYLKMRLDGPAPVANPIFLERSKVLTSGSTGIFRAEVEKGHTVAKGTVIGRITDFHGTVIEQIVAPFAGEILYVLGTPAISKGEPIAFIGSPDAEK